MFLKPISYAMFLLEPDYLSYLDSRLVCHQLDLLYYQDESQVLNSYVCFCTMYTKKEASPS